MDQRLPDGVHPLGLRHFVAVLFGDVEHVHGLIHFGGDLRQADIHVESGQGARDHVEQAQPVLGADVDDREPIRDDIVELDPGLDLVGSRQGLGQEVAPTGLDQLPDGYLPRDDAAQVLSEPVPDRLVLEGGPPAVAHLEGADHDAVRPAEELRR